jgi:7-carboxy-7-deazaguanine synthase
MTLTINEIFYSIQGESSRAGERCVFVRLTACDLRCTWCDTAYAFTEGSRMTLDDIVAQVDSYPCDLVEITGGEPLLQKNVRPLIERLLALGKTVMIETGGHLPIADLPPALVRIVDVKCPGSGEAAKMHWPNLDVLTQRDEVKFVVADRRDYEYARDVIRRHALGARCGAVHIAPVHGATDLQALAAWILEDALPVRFQVQLHKYIWGPEVRGV